MEKEPKKPEDSTDDSDDELDSDGNFKDSKKLADKKSIGKSKRASFFASQDTDKPATAETKKEAESSKTEESDDLTAEEFGYLSEEEVHEVILSVVDARMQEVSDELVNSTLDSEQEFSAMSSAIYLEELAHRASSDSDITIEDINDAYHETLADIDLGDSLEVTTEGDSELVERVGSLDRVSSELPEVAPRFSSVVDAPIPKNSADHYPATSRKTETQDKYEVYIPRSDMLLGVVVGYIIGRRGGRIRTEKRLKPEIKKLENQVAELSDAIINKEKLIRKQAQKIYEQSFVDTNKPNAVIERRNVRLRVNESLRRREQFLNDPAVERIGKFSLPALKVFHERRLPDGNENSSKRVQVEVMTTQELLEKIANLQIDGLQVSKMYESNRLNVKSLRQITKEYMRGGEFKKTFYRELLPDPNEIESRRLKVLDQHQTSTLDECRNSEILETQIHRSELNTSIPKSNVQNLSVKPNQGINKTTLVVVAVAVFIAVIAVIFLI